MKVLRRHLPILGWLPGYDRKRLLRGDAVAALSVWALLVPQSLAYATLAGVPVQYGLYTAFAVLLAYAVFGTSRHVIQGPSATVAAISAAVVGPIVGVAALGTDAAVGYTAALALAAGALYLLLGVLRMGWVSNFLSRAVIEGFILGLALGITIDQLHKLFGLPKSEGSYMHVLVQTLRDLPDTSGVTALVGLGSLALLLLLRYTRPRWPRALLVMVLSILVVGGLDLASHGVDITGPVPTGFFSVSLPGVGWSETTALALGALSVVFVGYAETLASARKMALKHHYEIDADQELLAQGVACGTAGLVGGFVTDGSLSKTSVADAAGQRTQMASLINAAMMLLTLLVLASLFENLPQAALGAVVIDAMVGLMSFAPMRRYYRVNRPDWVFFMGATLGILFFGIQQGVIIGVSLSLLLLIARASQTSIRRLGRDPGTDSYHDLRHHEGLETVPGVLVVRVDGPLFFADANRFRERLRDLVARATGPVGAVVVDADAIPLTDTDGADVLAQVRDELKAQGVELELARVHAPILALWQRAGAVNGDIRVYETVREAVAACANRVPAGARD